MQTSAHLTPLMHTRRRIGVAGLLAVAAALVSPGLAHAIWPFSDPTEREATDGHAVATFLAELIRQPTVFPPGNELAVARLVVDRLEAAGIEAAVIDTPGEGRAAAWARLPGSGRARPIVLLSHLDVVPADPSEWEYDPFAGEIVDGYVHGRGALDAKGVTAVQVFALLALAQRDAPLERDVILLATPGEETGGVEGAGYIARERADLLHDAEYLLTEGGSIRPRRRSATEGSVPSMWGITITEKSPCWLSLTTSGTPGHGSAPRSDAAVPRLIAALDRVRRVESPIRVLAEVEAMFLALAASSPLEDRAGFVSLATSLEEESDFRRRFLSQPGYNALVRNTISITVLEGGPKTNVVPATARAHLDARLLPGERCEDFTQAIRDVVADPGVEIDTLLEFPSVSSPADTGLFHAIERVARRHDPEAIVVPRMIGGFTDAHWFRALGIVSYGFVPRWIDIEDAAGVHGVDERVSVENLRAGVETTVEILEELGERRP
jgi:acetylornithine deacetylase/succinyl-diaminopimelate desuccinylase-like protein